MDEIMRHTFRRRRHTSNWVYTIVAVCILLVTLCILSLIPRSSGSSPDNSGTTPSPGLSGDMVGSENTEQNSPDNPEGSFSPQAPYITITINKDKFSSLIKTYQTNASAPSAQSIEAIRLQLQELALAREQLTAEREEFRTLYETACEERAAEKSDYLKKQQHLEAERKQLKEELNETETQLAQYDEKRNALESERQKLSGEEKELQETETQLQQLNEDITHAREQLTAERRELETGIQNIKENPNLSSESKETALLPLYAALEQLLMREAQLEYSEAEYKERSENLLAQKENLASRLQNYEADRKKLDEALAPYQTAQQEITASLKATEAELLPLRSELERLATEEAALEKEYRDKLTALDLEENRITKEEQSLQKRLASLQVSPDNSVDNETADGSAEQTNPAQSIHDQNTLAKRTMERILIILQEVPLSEDSNTASDILLTDVADITLTMP